MTSEIILKHIYLLPLLLGGNLVQRKLILYGQSSLHFFSTEGRERRNEFNV